MKLNLEAPKSNVNPSDDPQIVAGVLIRGGISEAGPNFRF